MSDQQPVRLKIYPVYGYDRWGNQQIVRSRNRCGACDAVVPDGVGYCPGCGVPIYGRVGPGSYSQCRHCGADVPNGQGRTRCPNCGKPLE